MDYLSQGSTGPAVKNLQSLLNFHLDSAGALPLKIDSIFGPKTNAAVVRFQQLNGLSVDGDCRSQDPCGLARYVTAQVAMTQYIDKWEGGLSELAPAITLARHRKGPVMANLAPSIFLAAAVPGQSPGQSQGQPPPASVVETSVVVQTGSQVNINPWFLSPFVFTLQANFLLKNDGRRPFVISPGVQLFVNQLGAPSGAKSGQAFIQMGPPGLFQAGNFDLLNPFVQAFVQINSGASPGAGFAIGNHANYNLLGDKLSLFINAQVVSTTDLHTGLTGVPSVQVLGGVAIDVFQLLHIN
jgi:peptidoglycan hydrolase-like protein with peptidoglycan-binding domain